VAHGACPICPFRQTPQRRVSGGRLPGLYALGRRRDEVRTLKEPEHGTIEFVAGESFPTFTDGSRAKCNGKKMPGMVVKYKSVKGYIGTDEFHLLAMFEPV
jgi:hypothetical protein